MGKLFNVKAILFDSGYTLNYPRTGYWESILQDLLPVRNVYESNYI